MQSFKNSMMQRFKAGLINREDAMSYSDSSEELQMKLESIYLSKDRGGILKR